MTLKTIVINSGCQSFGLAAALGALLPHSMVAANPLPSQFDGEAQERALAQQLAGKDVWVSSSHPWLAEKYLGATAPRVVLVPVIGFSAFHPDICYGFQRSTGALTEHHYNSAIGLWAYRHRILPEDARYLFNARVYRDLGYFNLWAPNVAALRDAFAECGLASHFDTFFLHIQRTGNFMHSGNHPKIHALVRLAKILALHLGSPRSLLEQHIEADDFLADTIWPMYPEVARSLSIPGGSYRWKINPLTWLDGVLDYLDFTYRAYQRQGIAPEDIGMYNRDDALYDRVLTAALGHSV